MPGLGISTSNTTAYHPQSNGLVERMHWQLKAALKAWAAQQGWLDDLPLVLLGLRLAWKEGPDSSPLELLYGTSLCLLGQFIAGSEQAQDDACPDAFNQMMFQKMRELRPVLKTSWTFASSLCPEAPDGGRVRLRPS